MPTLINRPGKAKAVDAWPLGEYRFMPQWDFVNSYLKQVGMEIDGKVYIPPGGGKWIDTAVYPAVYDDRVFPTPSLLATVVDKKDSYATLVKSICSINYQGNDILFGTGDPSSSTEKGLYRSTDLGKNWTRVFIPSSTGTPQLNNLPFFFKGKLWLVVPSNVHSSMDGGITWALEASYSYDPSKIGTVEGLVHYLEFSPMVVASSWPGTQVESPFIIDDVCYIAHRRAADNSFRGAVSYTEDGINWGLLEVPDRNALYPYFRILNNMLIAIVPQSSNSYLKIYYIDDGSKTWKGGTEIIDIGSSNDLYLTASGNNRSACNVLFYEDGVWYIPKIPSAVSSKTGTDVYEKLDDGGVWVSNMWRSTAPKPSGFVLNSAYCPPGSYGINGSVDPYTFGAIQWLPMPLGHVDDGFMINGQYISGKCLAEIYETASWPVRSTEAKAFQATSLYLSLSTAAQLQAGGKQITVDDAGYLHHRKSPFSVSKLIGANINASILPAYQNRDSYWVRIK